MKQIRTQIDTQARATGAGRKGLGRRGQSLMEMALVAPVLMLLFSVVVEGGLALNAWIRVTTAARDATRFALDAGRPADTTTLVLDKLGGIDLGSSRTFTTSAQLNIYIIDGTTNSSGTITSWSVNHSWGGGPNGSRVQQSTIQAQLQSQGVSSSQNLRFVLVEVDYSYVPLLATLVPRGVQIPMTSYSIIQKY
jgi:Flp pilus assembly protein TadG